jgi:hypothetical protein
MEDAQPSNSCAPLGQPNFGSTGALTTELSLALIGKMLFDVWHAAQCTSRHVLAQLI